MLIVDTHCHAGHSWFEPVELLLHQMNTNGVDRAVLIQHGGTYDNTYLLECARRFPGRFVVVAIVDYTQPDAPQTLEKWASEGIVGVRLPPGARSPGQDPLAIWRKASELGLLVSSLGGLDGFASDEFSSLVGQFPDMPIIVEHMAGVGPGAQPPYAQFKKAMALANHPNTYLKVGGLGEISTRPSVLLPEFRFDDTPPLIEMAYDAFGPRRMMWGSDYPPVSGREGYRNALQGVMGHAAFAREIDREWVMGKTAVEVFGLDK
ncbi:MAG: amidohydrolase [Chloroflexi bacterium]|nr:amidohydrolase [Chloroflexota bacterium]